MFFAIIFGSLLTLCSARPQYKYPVPTSTTAEVATTTQMDVPCETDLAAFLDAISTTTEECTTTAEAVPTWAPEYLASLGLEIATETCIPTTVTETPDAMTVVVPITETTTETSTKTSTSTETSTKTETDTKTKTQTETETVTETVTTTLFIETVVPWTDAPMPTEEPAYTEVPVVAATGYAVPY